VSENKENSRTRAKVTLSNIKRHISKEKMKKSSKKVKNIVDNCVALRYNVTRWRQMRFGAFKVTYEPVYYSII
jgi:hypothetical protein